MRNKKPKSGKKFTTEEIVTNSLFGLGLILNLLNLKLFEKTIIDWRVIAAIYLGSGLFYLPLQFMVKKWSNWDNFNWIVFCILVFGSFISFSLLGINFAFKDNGRYKRDFPIVKKYLGARRNSVTATIIVNQLEKDFRFPRPFEKDTYYSQVIRLDLSDGFFGISVINEEEIK